MRVMVTGASGFIGRHVVHALEAYGHVLNLAERAPGSVARVCADAARHRIVSVGDIDGQTNWDAALEGVDAVVHLAAHAHVSSPTAQDEAAFFETNVEGTDRLATQSVAAGVRRFLLMSSIGAVTASSESRVTLRTPCHPRTAYGRSKLASEKTLIERARDSHMTWTIVRPTLVYGPGNPGNMRRLVTLVKSRLPLPLGAIQNRRSFTFVKNLADLVARALPDARAAGEVFLVADVKDLSTPELIQKIAEISGRRARIFPVPLTMLSAAARGVDTLTSLTPFTLPRGTEALDRLSASLYVDTTHVRDLLEWSPPFGLDAGLRCMLAAS